MEQDPDASPINPLPPAVILLALPMVLVELWLSAGAHGLVGGPEAIGWRLEALQKYGFVPWVFDWMAESGRWRAAHLVTLVTYPFLHYGFTQMLMGLVFLLALGKLVGEAMGSRAVWAIFFASAVAGALALGLATHSRQPLAGAYPAVYGLVGAYTFLLWTRLGSEGGRRHRAFALIGALLFLQLVFGVLFGAGYGWVAEVVGFGTGFALSFVLVPGGWGRVLTRLRSR